jgi:phospholipid-translocating ATPase
MSLPPLAMGAFERDIDEDVIEQIPKTYQSSLDDKFFSKAKTVKYLLIGIWHSAVIYLSLYMLMYGQSFSDHKSVSYWLQSWFASSILMFILSGKYMLIVKNWMWIIQLSVGLSIAIYMVFFGVSDKIGLTTEGNSASNLHQFAEYYLFVLVTFFIALLPDILWRYAQLQWMPSDADILAECKRVSNDNTSGIFRRKLSKRNTRSVRVQRSADTKTQSVVTTQQINFLYDPANDKAAKSNGEDQIPTI